LHVFIFSREPISGPGGLFITIRIKLESTTYYTTSLHILKALWVINNRVISFTIIHFIEIVCVLLYNK